MFINKMGHEHYLYGVNNQDSGFYDCSSSGRPFKCVVDGCSEGKHSEVGAKLFCNRFQKGYTLDSSIGWNIDFNFYSNISEILNYMLFTVLVVNEYENEFIVTSCGDGYIILIDHNNKLTINFLDHSSPEGHPIYPAYKYVPEEKLYNVKHSDCEFRIQTFSKSEYKNVGVATDGLRYIFGAEFEEEFKRLLIEGKEVQIKRLINKYSTFFKDDITISL